MPIEDRAIDHIVLTVKDMDRSVEQYRRLGFQVLHRMYHPFGTANNLIMFQSTFFEILGIVDQEKAEQAYIGQAIAKLLSVREGVSHFALASSDAEADEREFIAKGFKGVKKDGFRRPVELPDGRKMDAVVSICNFDQSETPSVLTFISQQHVPEAVWVPEWQQHPNGAREIEGVTIVSDNPASNFKDRYTALLGENNLTVDGQSLHFTTPQGRIDILTPEDAAQRFAGADLKIEDKRPYIAAITIRTDDLGAVDRICSENGIPVLALETGGKLVPPEHTMGIAIEFVA